MRTEIFNTWNENWKRIPEINNLEELNRFGFSKDWVYFIRLQGKSLSIIRILKKDLEKEINLLESFKDPYSINSPKETEALKN